MMRKIVTVSFEFEPGDRVVYVGPVEPRPEAPGVVVGEEPGDYRVSWPDGDEDLVAKEDLRPYPPDAP